MSKRSRHILFRKYNSTMHAIQSHTGKQYNIIWITIFELHFGKTLHSMSLFSATRRSLDILLDRGESPERQLSSRFKIMSKLTATRNLCPVKKSSVHFHTAVKRGRGRQRGNYPVKGKSNFDTPCNEELREPRGWNACRKLHQC